MNANEWADLLDSKSIEGSESREVAHLLRKQAAEKIDLENEYSRIVSQNETNKTLLDDAKAEIEGLKKENQALKLCETNYPLEKHSKEWFQKQLARSDKIIFIERKLASEKLDEHRKQLKIKQSIIDKKTDQIAFLKSECELNNSFIKTFCMKITPQSYSLEWGDRDDEWTEEIKAAHPLNTRDHKAYEMAAEMVHNRHGKFALVALVNWLLRKANQK